MKKNLNIGQNITTHIIQLGELTTIVITNNERTGTEYKLTWTDGDITLVEHSGITKSRTGSL